MHAKFLLQEELRNAVARSQFVLLYQPQVDLRTGRLFAVEALVRWKHPNLGMILPMKFIPMAEEMRLIDKIGEWALREACRTAAAWPKTLTVAVNLSSAQFDSGELPRVVAAALKETGLEAHRLELEITESLLLRNNEKNMTQLHELKAMGASIVMDDFGTGYSSLSYLWRFPFDKIKIDRSFMQGLGSSGHDAETVVKTIIALGRELRMRVTVEGVETADQVDFLYDADADQVQGFYFGRPVPASEIAPALLKAARDTAAPQTKEPGSKTRLKFVS